MLWWLLESLMWGKKRKERLYTPAWSKRESGLYVPYEEEDPALEKWKYMVERTAFPHFDQLEHAQVEEFVPELGDSVWVSNDEGVIAPGTVGAVENGGFHVSTEIGLIWSKRAYRTFEEAFAGAVVDQLLKGDPIEERHGEPTSAPHLRLIRGEGSDD